MAFDVKKELKEFYQPKTKPSIVTLPKANYLAVRGTGDPNQEKTMHGQRQTRMRSSRCTS